MQTCERCGKQIPDRMSVCPSCGTVSYDIDNAQKADKIRYEETIASDPYQSRYGQYQAQQQMQQPLQYIPPNQAYQQPGFQQSPGYQASPGQAGSWYMPPPVNVRVINNSYPQAQFESGALIAEVLLSLIGIYGIGWLIAGKRLPGLLLLLGSIFIYWPLCIGFVAITFGLGIFCVGPLSIAAIIINALLLNNALKRKTQTVYMSPPFASAPPRF